MKVVDDGRILYKQKLVKAQIGIEKGKIKKIKKTGLKGEKIDASGCIVLPAGIDVHVHFRDFKEKQKEDWKTGSKAASAGGITTVFDHPNTKPPVKTTKVFKKKKKRAEKNSFVDFGINGAATKDTDLIGLAKNNVSAFGEVFFTKENNLGLLEKDSKKIFEEITKLNKKTCIHAEDWDIIKEKPNALDKDPIIYDETRPEEAEISAVKKALKNTNKENLHFCHLTTPEAVKLVSRSDKSSEVTPHHLFFKKSDLNKFKGYLKTNPPIRKRKTRNKLWKLFRKKQIDILASDHAPHTREEKEKNFWKTPSGVPGVETMYPLMAYQVKRKNLSLNRLVDSIAKKPAEIFGLNKGKIRKGKDADLAIFDFNEITEIKSSELHSKCGWTPYKGKKGIFPQKTILRGKIIWKNGNHVNKVGEMVEVER